VVADWAHGNAVEDGRDTRGWLVGCFIDPADGVRSSADVEVKWGMHPPGDKRPEWTRDDQRTTLVLLVQGSFRIRLTGGVAVDMVRQGDYVMWGPGVDHSWEALSDSVVVTVRWPSGG
jgi:hypothetical protein